jgi:enamine deaminase RidA (YjgF/YER057c/UK114 family)
MNAIGNFLPVARTGNLVYVSGHISGGENTTGKLGSVQTVESGYAAARSAADAVLATLERELGSLDRVVKLVKLLGLVNAEPTFTQTPAVINGASDRFIEALGERGRHARSAIGVASLPNDASVELELIAEVRD